MGVPKSLKSMNPPSGRRSFIWKMGAAMSAAFATTVPGMSGAKANQGAGQDADADRLTHRLGVLEDEKAIRTLHQSYESHLDNGRYEDVVGLFAEKGEVAFNGGVFEGKEQGVSRLYRECFAPNLTGKKIGTAPDFPAEQESIEVAADRLSARAQFPYAIEVGAPMPSDSQLVQMARLQGEGIMKWTECGMYEASYVKDARNGNWKIARLEYRTTSSTDYRPGRSHANPVSVPSFATTYPDAPSGPDRLITKA